MDLILYHGTDLKYANEIVQNGFVPKSNPCHWLGNGIYFYFDKSLAKWWTTNPTKKFGAEITTPAIVKTTIALEKENILDLRLFETYSKISIEYEKFFTEIYLPYHNQTINAMEFKCLFFDWYFAMNPQIKVIIGEFFSLEQGYLDEKARSFFEHTNLLFGETQVCLRVDCQNIIINKEILRI